MELEALLLKMTMQKSKYNIVWVAEQIRREYERQQGSDLDPPENYKWQLLKIANDWKERFDIVVEMYQFMDYRIVNSYSSYQKHVIMKIIDNLLEKQRSVKND